MTLQLRGMPSDGRTGIVEKKLRSEEVIIVRVLEMI